MRGGGIDPHVLGYHSQSWASEELSRGYTVNSNGASDNGVEKVIEQNKCNSPISDAAKIIRGRLC